LELVQSIYWGVQKRQLLTSFLHGWTFLFLMTIDPLILRVLLNSAQGSEGGDVPLNVQLLLVLVLSLSMLVRVSFMELCYFHSARLTNNVRSILVHAIFRKALCVPDHEVDAGRITNLMATDADKLGNTAWVIFSFSQWTWAVVSLPAVVYFLYRLVGIASLVAATVIILGSFVNRSLSRRSSQRTRQLQRCRDKRAKLMHELIRGIRTIKLQALEPLWLERISACRVEEMHALAAVRVYSALNSLVGSLLATSVPVTIFACYTLLEGRRLDAATAFTTLAWISTLKWSIQTLPDAYNLVADIKPSLDRISSFLSMPMQASRCIAGLPTASSDSNGSNQQPNSFSSSRPSGEAAAASARRRPLLQDSELAPMGNSSPGPDLDQVGVVHDEQSWLSMAGEAEEEKEQELAVRHSLGLGGMALLVDRASFGYLQPSNLGAESAIPEPQLAALVLKEVSLAVPHGHLVMVAGPVGAGKSCLLASLACARPALAGRCEVAGRRAYVAQKPFLLNATVRENVLFGLDLDQVKYEDALRRAALKQDLLALPAGEETLVGESGVQLSGGQKARVALARALYADADVVLLDDVLSAVDAHTGRFLWEQCIVGGLLKRGKTVVLVSHQLQYLSRPEVSSVVLLREGRIWLQGPWRELEQSDDELLSFVKEWEAEEAASDEEHAAELPSQAQEERE
ncbi:unnamed protein product, partial [Polarella glacialis]